MLTERQMNLRPISFGEGRICWGCHRDNVSSFACKLRLKMPLKLASPPAAAIASVGDDHGWLICLNCRLQQLVFAKRE